MKLKVVIAVNAFCLFGLSTHQLEACETSRDCLHIGQGVKCCHNSALKAMATKDSPKGFGTYCDYNCKPGDEELD